MQDRATPVSNARERASVLRSKQLQAVVKALSRDILRGTRKPGEQLPTVREIMADLDVANVTVQRAFSLLKKRRLIKTGVGRGSFVSDDAECLRTVALTYPYHPCSEHGWSLFYDATRQGAGTVEKLLGWRLPVFRGIAETGSELGSYDRLAEALAEMELGGIIFGENPYMLKNTPLVSPEFNLPCVGVMTSNAEFPHIPAVHFDFNSFFLRAIERIRSLGRKRVGFLFGGNYRRSLTTSISAHLDRVGLESAPWLMHGVPQHQPGWADNAVQGMLNLPRNQRPDALVLIDDHLVASALHGCEHAGVDIGNDLSVIAFCNYPVKVGEMEHVEYLGGDCAELVATALFLIRQQQLGRVVPDITLVKARFECELVDAGRGIVGNAIVGRPVPVGPDGGGVIPQQTEV